MIIIYPDIFSTINSKMIRLKQIFLNRLRVFHTEIHACFPANISVPIDITQVKICEQILAKHPNI
jgi:hypothetical protein